MRNKLVIKPQATIEDPAPAPPPPLCLHPCPTNPKGGTIIEGIAPLGKPVEAATSVAIAGMKDAVTGAGRWAIKQTVDLYVAEVERQVVEAKKKKSKGK